MGNQMAKPGTIDDGLWDYAQSYMRGSAGVIDPFDETYIVKQTFIKHRIDLDSAKTEYILFTNVARTRYVCDLDGGKIDQSKIAILHAPVVRVTQGCSVAAAAGPNRIFGTQTNIAAVQADAQVISDAYKAAAAIDEFLTFGFLSASVGKRDLLVEESGLSRFPFPGGSTFDGPGAVFGGTYPAATTHQTGAIMVGNGLQHVNNVYNQVPNAVLAGTIDLAMRINLPKALTIPAGHRLVAEVGYLATVFAPWRNG